MRSNRLASLALATLATAWFAGAARADDPYAEYNRQRAYHLFLTSPSPYRTLSGTTPGYARGYSTPYESAGEWQSPSYTHQRITPYGYERYDGPVQRGGYYAVRRPVFVAPQPYRPAPYPSPYYYR